MLPWIWTCWHEPARVVAPAARAVKRAFAGTPRPRVRHHIVGRVARKAPHAAAVAGKAVSIGAGATGLALACGWVPVPGPPAAAVPIEWPHAAPYVGGYGFGWRGLPGYLGLGGGVWGCGWCGGPVPGDAVATVPVPVSVPVVVVAGEVPPGGLPGTTPAPLPGPGPIPPATEVGTLPPGSPPRTDAPEPATLAVLLGGLAALAIVRRARR